MISGPWIAVIAAIVLIAAVIVLVIALRSRRARHAEAAPPPDVIRATPTPPTKDQGPAPSSALRGSPLPESDAAAVASAPASAADAAAASLTEAPEAPTSEAPTPAPPALETPEPPTGRLARLRARLAGSSGALGRALLAVLSRDQLTQDDWDELEEALLLADVGADASERILEDLRTELRVKGTPAPAPAEALRGEIVRVLDIGVSRELNDTGADGLPGVVLVVGVNGGGKTTTIGRLARLEVARGKTVLLGAADTFRAAAADQLATWGERVGVDVVRGPEGGDPASVAFDAVKAGIERGVDTVIIDTAGRLQNKANLMEELGKIARVAAKQAPITEVLLVLDATTGQNGLAQGRIFADVVNVTGLVLTKLDGSAKGGIVIGVQNELKVPVKLVGLGEGPDDLAPFDPVVFAEGMLS
jgi:fused signal recognition particle receptor